MRITIKNETKPTETKDSTAPPSLPPLKVPKEVPNLAKKIKVEKGLSGSKEKKTPEKSRKRKDSSSESAPFWMNRVHYRLN